MIDPLLTQLTMCMTDIFGEHFSRSEAKTLTEVMVPGQHLEPRFNSRGTELLAITKGSASINKVTIRQGDIIRIDVGDIVDISSPDGCELTSLIFPYYEEICHVPYSNSNNPELLGINNNNNNKVSIIIIAKDIQHHITHAINSCLMQTYSNLQILVVNDASEDETGVRAASMADFDPRIEVYTVDLGANGARRYGLEKASGDFCLMLDGDDWLNRDAVEKLLATAGNLDSELVIFGFDHYNDKTREHFNALYPSFEPKVDVLLPEPVADHDARETARINHTVWISFFSINLRPYAMKAMLNIYLYEDLPFSLLLMQHAKRPSRCNLILHHYRRERAGQATEKWWKVLPSQKQACLRLAIEHTIKQFESESSDYYCLILIYKIDQIINYEIEGPQSDAERNAWRTLLTDLLALFPEKLQRRLVEEGIKNSFEQSHITKTSKS